MNKFIIIGIVISVIIAIILIGLFVSHSETSYTLEIIDLNTTYLIVEPIDYIFRISGIGSSCGNFVTGVTNGEVVIFSTSRITDCEPSSNNSYFKIDLVVDSESIENNFLLESGEYVVFGNFTDYYGDRFTVEQSIVIENNATP